MYIPVYRVVISDMRGFMTHKGIPDYARSARVILKDFVNVRK